MRPSALRDFRSSRQSQTGACVPYDRAEVPGSPFAPSTAKADIQPDATSTDSVSSGPRGRTSIRRIASTTLASVISCMH